MTHILKFLLLQRNSIQRWLYLFAFTVFGAGDAVTGALLMGTKGTAAESNFMFRYIYETQGAAGFIVFKLWLTFCLLLMVHFTYIRSHGKNYWSVNGLLTALTLGGLMAVMANYRAASGLPHSSSINVIFIYFILTICLIEVGDRIDSMIAKKSSTEQLIKPDGEQKNIPTGSKIFH